ncbi:MAG: methyltransferase domain-containing protein [Betaproteobacteria bacterium]
MASDLTFTGERFVPACVGEIAYEHWHRYAFARRYAEGARVLDAACGEGYGTALLGTMAAEAVGIDIDAAAIRHAQSTYGTGRIRFVEGSCTLIPLPDASLDMVVSFETIEHLEAADQPRMLAEFARVLKPDGLLVISSPNKRLYSDARGYVNEFHRHELYRDGLCALLSGAFPAQRWFHQRLASWSEIWREGAGEGVGEGIEAWLGESGRVSPYAAPEGMYFIVVAARAAGALPDEAVRGSLFTDAEETEQKRAQANASEVLRQDALLKERDAALDRQTAHVHHLEALIAQRDAALDQQTGQVRHLEALIAERERIIADKDGQLAALDAVREQREQLIALRDRELAARDVVLAATQAQVEALERECRRQDDAMIASAAAFDAERSALRKEIAAGQSLGWWLALPWHRLRLWLRGR